MKEYSNKNKHEFSRYSVNHCCVQLVIHGRLDLVQCKRTVVDIIQTRHWPFEIGICNPFRTSVIKHVFFEMYVPSLLLLFVYFTNSILVLSVCNSWILPTERLLRNHSNVEEAFRTNFIDRILVIWIILLSPSKVKPTWYRALRIDIRSNGVFRTLLNKWMYTY